MRAVQYLIALQTNCPHPIKALYYHVKSSQMASHLMADTEHHTVNIGQ